MCHSIHFHGSFANQEPQHFALRRKFHQRELNGLICRQRFPKRLALSSICDGLIDAIHCCSERRSCLADAVFVHKGLRDGEALIERTDDGRCGDANIGEGDGGVVGGHV